jgi:hypothetical protein
MEDMRIIFPSDTGGVVVLIPADKDITLEELAARIVPAGRPYKIIHKSEVPSDRTFRDAWEYRE